VHCKKRFIRDEDAACETPPEPIGVAAFHFSHLSFRFSFLGASSLSFWSFLSFFLSFVSGSFALQLPFVFLLVWPFLCSWPLPLLFLRSSFPLVPLYLLLLLCFPLSQITPEAGESTFKRHKALRKTSCLLCGKIAVTHMPLIYAVGMCNCVWVRVAHMAVFVETQIKENGTMHPLQIFALNKYQIKWPQSAHAVEPGALKP